MTKQDLLDMLNSSSSLAQLFRELVVDAVPWIFGGNRELYEEWKAELATELGISGDAVQLVGSAAVGYSLSPLKAGRAFKPVVAGERAPSDIDIAIVDQALFTSAWNDLVREDRRRRLPTLLRSVGYRGGEEKVRLDVYHGVVASSNTLPGSAAAGRFRLLASAVSRRSPFRGHYVSSRVYRRHQDFLDYHEQSLAQLRREIDR